MNRQLYEALIHGESELSCPSATICEFCTAGLKRFDEYKELDDFQIYASFMLDYWEKPNAEENTGNLAEQLFEDVKQVQIENIERDVLSEFYGVRYKKRRKFKRATVAMIAVLSSFVLITAVSATLRYSFIDLLRNVISSPDQTIFRDDGFTIFSEGGRFYGSWAELLEAENLSILYPRELPQGYEFTEFQVSVLGESSEIWAGATEPFIGFTVRIGSYNTVERYDYEINDIKFYVVELGEGLYQAGWNYNDDYYTMIIGNRDLLFDIIKNLRKY